MQVVVGRIGRAHGIRGELNVEARTDEPERRFAPGSSVLCAGRSLTVERARPHQGKWILKFEQIPDRTAAETLHGKTLHAEVDPDEVPDDGFYDHQLVGLMALSDGREVGRVVDVLHLPAHDTLVLDRDGQDVLVPFVEALVPDVDLAAGTLTILDRPGLLDPTRADEVRQ